MPSLFDDPPAHLATTEYTLIVPWDVACELIAGRVPRDVVEACISGIKAMCETPDEFVKKPKRRRSTREAA